MPGAIVRDRQGADIPQCGADVFLVGGLVVLTVDRLDSCRALCDGCQAAVPRVGRSEVVAVVRDGDEKGRPTGNVGSGLAARLANLDI